MKKYIFLCLLFSFSLAKAQDTVKASPNGVPAHTLVENPRFNGDLSKYIGEHLIYPQTSAQGTVYIAFTVEADGTVTNVKVAKGVAPALDSAAVSCIRGMPKWKPSTLNGKPVKNTMELPIQFAMPVIEQNSVNPDTPPRVK